MRSLACKVPKAEAEFARAELVKRRLVPERLVPVREAGWVYFPLAERPSGLPYEIVERDFTERTPRPERYQELLSLPAELQSLLPGGYDLVGDVVVVRLEDPLMPHKTAIGKALLDFVPAARVVALDHGVHGEARLRSLETIAGEGPFESWHQENGLRFKVDLSRAYFSPRLSVEHERIAQGALDGERFLDLFCGIGPFALTVLSRHPHTTAVALDSNPGAIALLEENARRMNLAARITAVLGDAHAFLSEPQSFDRVVMNLPHEGYKYVKLVAPHVKSPGWLHFYGLVPREKAKRSSSAPVLPEKGAAGEALRDLLGTPSGSGEWTLRGRREVHAYSPSLVLECFTLERR